MPRSEGILSPRVLKWGSWSRNPASLQFLQPLLAWDLKQFSDGVIIIQMRTLVHPEKNIWVLSYFLLFPMFWENSFLTFCYLFNFDYFFNVEFPVIGWMGVFKYCRNCRDAQGSPWPWLLHILKYELLKCYVFRNL